MAEDLDGSRPSPIRFAPFWGGPNSGPAGTGSREESPIGWMPSRQFRGDDTMRYIKACLYGIDWLNYWVARIASWAVVIIIAATVYEVIMRYVFNAPTIWVFEFNYLLHGPYFLLLGAYTFAINGHVNVDVFYGRLSPRGRAIIDLFTLPLFFFFIGMMFVYGGIFFLNALAFKEQLSSAWAPPVYPIKMVIPLAAALLILQGIARYIRCLHLAITGKEGAL